MKENKGFTRKVSKKKIRKVDQMIRNLPVIPQTFTYVDLYHILETLHFRGEYALTCSICDALMKKS